MLQPVTPPFGARQLHVWACVQYRSVYDAGSPAPGQVLEHPASSVHSGGVTQTPFWHVAGGVHGGLHPPPVPALQSQAKLKQ